MMELVFFGGTKGVGKTTLLHELAGFTYFHPGEIYWQNETKPLEEIRDLITQAVLSYDVSRLLLDTHYAGHYRNLGYLPCWDKKSIDEIVNSPKVTKVELYLLDASPQQVYDRRIGDTKKRRLDLASITEDLEQNRRWFLKTYNALGHQKHVTAHIIQNHDSETTLRLLSTLVKPSGKFLALD